MDKEYFTGLSFSPQQPEATPLLQGDYEDCDFNGCDLSGADLSHFSFIDCRFTDCNLSLAKLVQTAFRDVVFKGCKLTGLHFDHCKATLFSARFEHCNLSMSSFYGMKIKNFHGAQGIFHETDFAEADLEQADFSYADLKDAVFEKTNLKGADFRHALHYRIDPELNSIGKALFSLEGLPGLLNKYGIKVS